MRAPLPDDITLHVIKRGVNDDDKIELAIWTWIQCREQGRNLDFNDTLEPFFEVALEKNLIGFKTFLITECI